MQLQFYIDVKGDRPRALERRDEIIDALKRLGFDLILASEKLTVFLSDDHGASHEKAPGGQDLPVCARDRGRDRFYGQQQA